MFHGAIAHLHVSFAHCRPVGIPCSESGPSSGCHLLSGGGASAGPLLSGSAGPERLGLRLREPCTGRELRHHHTGGTGLHRLCHRQRVPAQRVGEHGQAGGHCGHPAGRYHHRAGGYRSGGPALCPAGCHLNGIGHHAGFHRLCHSPCRHPDGGQAVQGKRPPDPPAADGGRH